MKIEILQEFIRLSETLSFSQTAEELYLSTSVLSRHISALEVEVGTELFTRDNRNIQLTPAGRIFVKGARKIVDVHSETLAAIRELCESARGELRVGYLRDSVMEFLPKAFETFSQHDVNTQLVFQSLSLEDLPSAISEGSIDIALGMHSGTLDKEVYGEHRLFEDRFVAVVSPQSDLAGKTILSMDDFDNHRIISRKIVSNRSISTVDFKLAQFIRFFDERDMVSFEITDASPLAFTLLADKDAIGIIPTHAAETLDERLVSIPVEQLDFPLYVSAFWNRENETSALLYFAHCVEQAAHEIIGKRYIPSD